MSAASGDEQSVERSHQVLRPAAFLDQAGPFRALNPALHRIFVETSKHLV